jgi:hypothetical protein
MAGSKQHDVAKRFWEKVDKNGPTQPHMKTNCWLWTAGRNHDGYGKFRASGVSRYAHRAVFELTHGEIPAGLLVLHRCDIPACVRPAHLYAGTPQDNATDMCTRGRKESGDRHWKRRMPGRSGRERNPNAKLSEQEVECIRHEHATGSVSQTTLAARYHVTQCNISAIVRGKTWSSSKQE